MLKMYRDFDQIINSPEWDKGRLVSEFISTYGKMGINHIAHRIGQGDVSPLVESQILIALSEGNWVEYRPFIVNLCKLRLRAQSALSRYGAAIGLGQLNDPLTIVDIVGARKVEPNEVLEQLMNQIVKIMRM